MSDPGLLPVEPALRVVIRSVLDVQKSQCTGCGLPLPLSCVGCPSICSLKQCLTTDILVHLLEQIGQSAEPTAHRSINRCVHPKQSPSRLSVSNNLCSLSISRVLEASSRIPVPHASPERTTTSCVHNTTADFRSNRALLPHTQQPRAPTTLHCE